jgi:regulator-associated protein of mTOR
VALRADGDLPAANGPDPLLHADREEEEDGARAVGLVACLPQTVVLCEQRHDGFDEAAAAAAGPSTSGPVSKWRPKDRVPLLPPLHLLLIISSLDLPWLGLREAVRRCS